MPIASAPLTRAVAGDTWSWTWSHAEFPASAGWAVAWRVIGTGIALDIPTVADGDAHVATAAAAATGALVVPATGLPCTLVGWATKAGQRFEVYRRAIALLPDPATVTGDIRGQAARLLDAIDALLAGRATKDQESYKIGDRELKRIPVPELIALRDWAAGQAQAEALAEAVAQGRPRATRVLTRMVRG